MTTTPIASDALLPVTQEARRHATDICLASMMSGTAAQILRGYLDEHPFVIYAAKFERDIIERHRLSTPLSEESALVEALRGVPMMESVESGQWKLIFAFGSGDDACLQMRSAADIIRKAITP